MDVHGDSILVKMFISLKIQNPGLQLYPHNKMFHKWNVDLVTEYTVHPSLNFKPFSSYKRHSLVPRPHPLTRRNGLVNQVEFPGLAHFCDNVT